MSGQIKIATVIAAGATNVNLLTGRKQEFLSRPAVVTVYQVQDTGVGVGATDLTLGNVVVGEDLVPNDSAVGFGPRTNEDMISRGVGAAGDRIQIRVRETGGIAILTVRTLVTIDDL